MRHFHLTKNQYFNPIINLDKLWTLVGEEVSHHSSSCIKACFSMQDSCMGAAGRHSGQLLPSWWDRLGSCRSFRELRNNISIYCAVQSQLHIGTRLQRHMVPSDHHA